MLQAKTVLVTGASRGIGLLTVKTLARQGHRVYAGLRDINGRNAEVLEQLQRWACEGSYPLQTIELDVTDDDSVNRAVAEIEQQAPLDVLVNNAGIMPVGITEAFTVEQLQQCLEVNVLAVMRTSRAVLPAMRQRNRGLIISLSSTAGRLAIPCFGVYCASKWALEALVESMHLELQPLGIASVLVEPGGHATDLIKSPPSPLDLQCASDYGSRGAMPAKIIALFEAMFAAGESITDARHVADAVAQLVNTEPPYPVRTTVGSVMGVDQLNTVTAPLQDELTAMLNAL